MPIVFEPNESSAFDSVSGVLIPQPRMVPATLSDGRDVIEYQYSFRRDGERIGGLGIFGTEQIQNNNGRRTWVYTLELTQDSGFERLFRLKDAIENKDDNFTFVQNVAQGLVNVFAGQTDNTDAQLNLVVTNLAALERAGIQPPPALSTTLDGTVILAECMVPAHGSLAAQQ